MYIYLNYNLNLTFKNKKKTQNILIKKKITDTQKFVIVVKKQIITNEKRFSFRIEKLQT